jgi:hypothetical protein
MEDIIKMNLRKTGREGCIGLDKVRIQFCVINMVMKL